MTNEEAAMVLRYTKAFRNKKTLFTEAVDLAAKALEKQIPKKSIITNFGNGAKQITCNTCSMCLHGTSSIKYCPHCGQKICWEEDEK